MADRFKNMLENYRRVLLIRLFEEEVQELFSEGRILGTCHLCIGQEAVAVGVANVLRPGDQVVSCHRGHGHLLAMGGDPARLLGELMGKQMGYCRGRGGSQHLSAPEIGFLGTNGITGGGIPLATGAALTAQMRNTGAAVVSFFGDGATSQGTFHESLNMASLWRLPILYLCENNGYAMSTPVVRTVAGGDIANRAKAYSMPFYRADGMDVEAMQKAVERSLEHVRGRGPAFLEAITYRYCGHSKSDRLVYRTREEEAAWKAKDPVVVLRSCLEKEGQGREAEKVYQEVASLLERVVGQCLAAPDADVSDVTSGVYANG